MNDTRSGRPTTELASAHPHTDQPQQCPAAQTLHGLYISGQKIRPTCKCIRAIIVTCRFQGSAFTTHHQCLQGTTQSDACIEQSPSHAWQQLHVDCCEQQCCSHHRIAHGPCLQHVCHAVQRAATTHYALHMFPICAILDKMSV
jgi:hypothetical protein